MGVRRAGFTMARENIQNDKVWKRNVMGRSDQQRPEIGALGLCPRNQGWGLGGQGLQSYERTFRMTWHGHMNKL